MALAAGFAILTSATVHTPAIAGEAKAKVSRFGEYSGYTEQRFDGYDRESLYVPMRDGTRLAVDIYHPTKNGERAIEQLPIVLRMAGYWRAHEMADGSLVTIMDDVDENVGGVAFPGRTVFQDLMKHGYIVATADPRGSGASFGKPNGFMSLHYSRDSYDLIEWLGAQSWSSGRVGMIGASYMANAQIAAASEDPPSLKALFPEVGAFDWTEEWASGGISLVDRPGERWMSPGRFVFEILARGKIPKNAFDSASAEKRLELDNIVGSRVPPVDGPDGERLLAEVLAEREKTLKAFAQEYEETAGATDSVDNIQPAYRNDCLYRNDCSTYTFNTDRTNPADHLPQLNQAKIPTYYFSGWRDATTTTPLLWHKNLEGPKKTIIGPWGHGPKAYSETRLLEAWSHFESVESLRWFDYWLKGIDNGVMDEPALAYSIMQEDPAQWTWRTSEDWPDANVERSSHYFSNGDVLILDQTPPATVATASYDVDVTATYGRFTRYIMNDVIYPEMSANNAKGITYTSSPLEDDLTVVGAPIVTLNVLSTAPDGEFHVSLQRVDADGKSHFVTEGKLKASHRVLTEAPYDTFGLPWHDRRKHVVEATPPLNEQEATELKLWLSPTAFTFEKGSRLRVAIVGADADFSYQEPVDPAPVVTIVSGGKFKSGIELPILMN